MSVIIKLWGFYNNIKSILAKFNRKWLEFFICKKGDILNEISKNTGRGRIPR